MERVVHPKCPHLILTRLSHGALLECTTCNVSETLPFSGVSEEQSHETMARFINTHFPHFGAAN